VIGHRARWRQPPGGWLEQRVRRSQRRCPSQNGKRLGIAPGQRLVARPWGQQLRFAGWREPRGRRAPAQLDAFLRWQSRRRWARRRWAPALANWILARRGRLGLCARAGRE
jgi:hypothetical protein